MIAKDFLFHSGLQILLTICTPIASSQSYSKWKETHNLFKVISAFDSFTENFSGRAKPVIYITQGGKNFV